MTKVIINIDVPSLDAGTRFYTKGLGFELKRTLFQRSVAELTLGDSTMYLITHEAGTQPFPGSDKPRAFERHWTPVHLDIVVDNMPSAVDQALQAGAVQSGATAIHPWGKLTPLADPFGHGICLLEFSLEGYDSVAD